jgi:hypothetical protein
VLKAMIIWVFGWLFWMQEYILPDPKVSYFTQMQSQPADSKTHCKEGIRNMDRGYAPWFASRYATAPQWQGYPYDASLSSVRAGSTPEKEYRYTD